MSQDEEDRSRECFAEFDRLFPQGFAGIDVVQELAPTGWENSSLAAFFRPAAESLDDDVARMRENICSLAPFEKMLGSLPESIRAEFEKTLQSSPKDQAAELAGLVGKCLWEIFSDNHEVVAPDGSVFDLGSFRYAAGMLAEYLNEKRSVPCYNYMDFYLGTTWMGDLADFTPVYHMIFRRLKERHLEWIYHFPEIHAVDFRPLRDALAEKAEPDWTDYSPEEALAKEREDAERDKELAELREQLDQGNSEAKSEALKNPPPKIVAAYHSVYGKYPTGWPPLP